MVLNENGRPRLQADEPILNTVNSHYNGNLQFIHDFGVWHLSINEAAELVALDMWHSGEISDIEEPEDWDGSEHDPRLRELLSEHIKAFQARLQAAVDCGRLNAATQRRDFDERLISEETYVNYSDFTDWLRERGYESGDIIAEWHETEMEIAELVCDEVAYLRASRKGGKGAIRGIALQGLLAKAGRLKESESSDVVAAYKAVVRENQHLKEQLAHAKTMQPPKVDRPLPTRQRRTLLTIIAALCKHKGIEIQERGTAQRIVEMTDDLGAHVDNGTIASLFSEIPEALETRMK